MEGTPNTPTGDAVARRLRPVLTAASLVLVLLLAFFAWQLLQSQSDQRQDLEERFTDRADVAASVNEALFSLATSQQMAADVAQFGGETVDAAALRRRVAQNNSIYAQIVDAEGKVLAEAGNPPDRDPASLPHYRKALRSGRTEYSSLIEGPNGTPILEGATPFRTPNGVRVDISGSPGAVIASFLNGFLRQLPNVDNARSYVVDDQEKLVAAPGTKIAAGADLPDRELATAINGGRSGTYGDSRYFTSSPIEGTPWRIVLGATQDDLYEPIDRTTPWLILAAFVLAAVGGVFLLWRVLVASTELARAELSRRHALEINDNVVQRLVIAKYALDRGATETSQQKLAETLRETQQLVTSLLEQKEIVPGALRREIAAPTEGPPPPPEARRPQP